ncbi:MAG: hypothetical protein ACM3Q2_01125 [Syntrophothermus sp.]
MNPGSFFRKYWHILVPSAVFLIHTVIILFLLPNEPVKDERVFYPAALSFRQLDTVFSYNFLRTYESPQTPLSFIFSGVLLNINNSLTILRMSDAVIVFFIILLFCRTIRNILPDNFFLSLLPVLTFIINPYLHFIGIYYYTDAPYLLFTAIAVYAIVINRKSILYYTSLFMMPLIRQFGVIYPAGSLIDGIKKEKNLAGKEILFSLLSLSGLAFFILLWGGLMPENSFRADMIKIREKFGSVYPYIPAYNISAAGFYLAPLFIFMLKDIYKERRSLLCGFAAALFYIIFPARQNYMTAVVQPYNVTLGFYHKLFLQTLGDPLFHIVLAAFAFLAGMGLYALFSSSDVKRIFKVWIILFFAVSFFNLQAWDKYLLDAELVMLVSGALFYKNSGKEK